jgi:RNA polymerase sigma-70 factor (ECF subfamily)
VDGEGVGGSAEGLAPDAQGVEAMFDRYHSAIWTFLARLGGRDHADDLAGEVFVIALSRHATYDPSRGSFRSWLYGIAANLSRNRLRSETRRARAFARVAAERQESMPSDSAVDEMALHAQLASAIEALTRLSATDREVIVLFAWERLSYEEIAEALQVEVGTVRSRLARARARLRSRMEANTAPQSGTRRQRVVEGNDHG